MPMLSSVITPFSPNVLVWPQNIFDKSTPVIACIRRSYFNTGQSRGMLEHATSEYSPRQISNAGPFSFIHSRIHSFKDLYSTSSRKLLGGAPDSSTVKKNSF